MAKLQRYISNELTHFVGRNTRHDADTCYKLLTMILKSGWLMHAPHRPDVDSELTYVPTEKISRNNKYLSQVVCFCDIPADDFQIHMQKYSYFGLSFTKEFLTQKGANPVFYIANDSLLEVRKMIPYPIMDPNDPKYDQAAFEEWLKKCYEAGDHMRAGDRDFIYDRISRSEYFDSMEQRFNAVLELAVRRIVESGREDASQFARDLNDVSWEIRREVFSFMKFFDAGKNEEDPDNYYMEREWRKWGNLQFTLEDVSRVILPKDYAARFRKDVPDYIGQITFSEIL